VNRCPACQSLNDPDDAFCSGCGGSMRAAAVAPKRCAACQSLLEPSDPFCGQCGARVGAPVPAAAPARPPAQATPTAPAARPAPPAAPGARPAPPASSAPSAGASPAAGNTTVHGASGKGRTLFVVPRGHEALGSVLASHGLVHVLSAGDPHAQTHVALRAHGASAVCLVGAPWQLPMASVPDPTGKDECVYTDNFYGLGYVPDERDVRGGAILPELPVGRIPFTDPALVAQVLARATLVPHWAGGLAVSTAVWKGASAAVLKAIAGTTAPQLWHAPPVGERQIAEAMSGPPGRLFFNVHGTDQEAVWVGDDGSAYPPVLRPKHIRVAPSAIVVSEACYGANLVEDEDAISTTFLGRGAGCFVGSTIIAWGPAEAPPSLADVIVVGVYQGLDQGLSAGEALLHAKRTILESAIKRGGPISPQVHNTLLSFVLYGSPDARVAGVKPAAARPVQLKTRPAQGAAKAAGRPGSLLDQTRARMGGGASSTLGDVRDRMSSSLGAGDWQELSRGRVAFAQLAAELKRGADLQRRISGLLGATPSAVELLRYSGDGQKRVSVTATEQAPWGKKHVAMVTDDEGAVIEEYVSR
jgi:hypothetical protein